MLLAKYPDKDTLIRASPGSTAICPHCGSEVISKCGSINIWHWAHKTKCIYETEPMTDWHYAWQDFALKNGCDIEVKYGSHIADAVKGKNIFEFQHSSISSDDVFDRCADALKNGYQINWIFEITSKKLSHERRYRDPYSFKLPSRKCISKLNYLFGCGDIYLDFSKMYAEESTKTVLNKKVFFELELTDDKLLKVLSCYTDTNAVNTELVNKSDIFQVNIKDKIYPSKKKNIISCNIAEPVECIDKNCNSCSRYRSLDFFSIREMPS